MRISKKECPEQFKEWSACMEANPGNESACLDLLKVMDKCAIEAFRRTNPDPNYTY